MLDDSNSTPVNTVDVNEQEEQGSTEATHTDIVLKVKGHDASCCAFH